MQQLLLLHAAIGTSLQMLKLVNELTDTFTVQRLYFSGHGGSPFAGAPFSIPLFAGEVISFLDKKGIRPSTSLDIAWLVMWPCIGKIPPQKNT